MNENDKEQQEVEMVDPEIETEPEAGGLILQTRDSVQDQLYLAENIDKVIAAQNKIRAALMKLAQPGDWVIFGKEDKAKAELGFAGSNRIGATLGVNFTNFEAKKEKGTDDVGEWYRWEVECDASYRSRIVRVYGRAGSRDKFFGKEHGEFKPLSQVDEGNLKICARRAAMKEGIKVLFGLHHMDPAYLKQFGVKLESAGGYEFKGREAESQETETVVVGVAEITQKAGGSGNKTWTKYSIKDSEGAVYSTFDKNFAEIAKLAKTEGKNVQISFKKTQYGPEITALEMATEF